MCYQQRERKGCVGTTPQWGGSFHTLAENKKGGGLNDTDNFLKAKGRARTNTLTRGGGRGVSREDKKSPDLPV